MSPPADLTVPPETFAALADELAADLGLDASGHDLHHAWRVFDLGLDLAAAEGADPAVVGAAALTHDLHRVVPAAPVKPRETLPRVRDLLAAASFPADRVEPVCHAVAVHEEYGFDYQPTVSPDEASETVEAAVLQDADNLDAMGAVGIGRTFTYAGAHGNAMWTADPSPEWVPWDAADDRDSTIDHFDEKLLHLRDDMNTERGRELAERRHEVLAEFVERFRAEWHGEA